MRLIGILLLGFLTGWTLGSALARAIRGLNSTGTGIVYSNTQGGGLNE